MRAFVVRHVGYAAILFGVAMDSLMRKTLIARQKRQIGKWCPAQDSRKACRKPRWKRSACGTGGTRHRLLRLKTNGRSNSKAETRQHAWNGKLHERAGFEYTLPADIARVSTATGLKVEGGQRRQ